MPRKCKLWYFHARNVIIHSSFILCSEAWQAQYRRRNTTLCHWYLTQLHSWNSAALFSWVPSNVALQKNLHVDPDSRSNRKTCGVIVQEAVSAKCFFLLLPFKNFLLHFCILTWYPFKQMGSFFFLELCRIFHTKTATIFLSSFHCQETKACAALEKFKESIFQPGPAAVRCLASDRTGPSDRPYSVFKWSVRDALCLKFIPAQDCEHSVQ